MPDSSSGFAFPFRIDPATGRVTWSTGKDKVRQNVALILGTRAGERPMLRDFGTSIPSLVHDPNGAVLANTVREQILSALLRFENRILGTSVTIDQRGAEMTVRLSYVYIDEGASDHLVVAVDSPR